MCAEHEHTRAHSPHSLSLRSARSDTHLACCRTATLLVCSDPAQEFVEACVVEDFPEGCDPIAQRDAAREALTKHIQGVVDENYKALANDLL